MIGKTMGRYQITGAIGKGGMGEVYRAIDTSLDRDVALKVLPQKYLSDKTARERFIREARLGAKLAHANICTVYEVGEYAGNLFIAMEYIQGRTLHQEIAEEPMDPSKFIEIACQIADALQKAHEKSIVHRDLKPSNIMIGMDQKVKILDFGLAKLVSSAGYGDNTATTKDFTITGPFRVGTLAYMSPEQISGNTVDARSDIFSAGVIFYEMYTGKHPFRRAQDTETIAAILLGTPPAPTSDYSDSAADLQRIILKCLKCDPRERYQTARELLQDLSAAASGKSDISVAKNPSIAILPFINLSQKRKDDYFSHGVTEEIITRLSKIPNLLVISGTCTMRFRDQQIDARDVGRELGVAAVLKGEVLHSGHRCRVAAQLIDVKSGLHLWADSYDIDIADVFRLQNRLSACIARALRVQTQKESSEPNAPTVVMEAYRFYLKGKQWYYSFQNQENISAIRSFKKALRFDPYYAQAYAALASACVARVERQWEKDYSCWLKRALQACERSIELNPNLAESYSARALIHFWRKGLELAEADAQKALRIDANDDIAQNVLGRIYFQKGHFFQAVRQFRLALRTNPYYVWCMNDLAWVLWLLGEYAEATQILDRLLLINPTDEGAHIGLAVIHLLNGRVDDALKEAEKSRATNPDYFLSIHVRALIWLKKGLYSKAVAICREAIQKNPRDFLAHATLGIIYAQKGVRKGRQENEAALQMESFYAPLSLNIAIVYCHFGKLYWARRWLQKAFADGIKSRLILRHNPYLRRLQGECQKKGNYGYSKR